MSQTSPFPPIGPNKPFPGRPVASAPMSQGSSGGGVGRACGCFLVGCGGLVALLIGMCGFGYYALFHTAWPLQLVKSQIEESGVKIEGLRGNVTNGVEIDSIEIPSDFDIEVKTDGASQRIKTTHKSSLKNLKLKYKSGGMFGGSTMIVEEASVGSGTLYVPLTSEGADGGNAVDTTDVIEDLTRAFDEVENEFSNASFQGSGEMRIDRVVINDLTLVDPNTHFEYKIDEISYRDFSFSRGSIANLGDLTIKTDNLEVQTEPGGISGASLRGRHLAGKLKPGVDEYILREIPFEVDYEISSQGKLAFRGTAFDQQIEFPSAADKSPHKVAFKNFEPDRFIRLRRPAVHPSQLDLRLQLKGTIVSVEPGGSFHVGQTLFEKVRLGSPLAGESNWVESVATVAEKPVTARLYLTSGFPMSYARLYCDGYSETPESLRDLWAVVAFGKAYSELSVDDQDRVTHAVDKQLLMANPPQNNSSEDSDADEGTNEGEIESASPQTDPSVGASSSSGDQR